MDTREIPLTRGLSAIVDAADYEWLSQWKWLADPKKGHDRYFLATRTVWLKGQNRSSKVAMHRQIMTAQPGQIVDHINRNTLDNRRSNLRIATARQNALNRRSNVERASSRFKGVSWDAGTQKWRARFNSVYLGIYQTEEDAAEAYDRYALRVDPDFAFLNRPGRLECLAS